MRFKLVLAALFFFAVLPAVGQVKPAANFSGIPLGVGVGFMDYSIGYAPGDRIMGVSAWADYSFFRGLGLEAEGAALNFDAPARVGRFSQYTIKGGPIYKARSVFGLHPYVKALFGVTQGNFALRDNFYYTSDDFLNYSYGGGVEYKAWKNIYVRADYQYEFVRDYLILHDLNPNGVTIGATYYLRTPRGYK